MGLFNKNKKQAAMDSKVKLAELPRLPELPSLNSGFDVKKPKAEIHQLPKIPSSSFGNKFSQDTIKEAVSGKRGDMEDVDDSDFSDMDDMDQMMLNPPRKPMIKELDEEIEAEELGMPAKRKPAFRGQSASVEAEPIFIRIDKFEAAMHAFQETKDKLSEIEHTLSSIKKVKEHEEEEIKNWEQNIRLLKSEIEKVDRDIFSKI